MSRQKSLEMKRHNWFITLLIGLGSLMILFPLYLTVTIALKTPTEMAASIFTLPGKFRIENFIAAIEATNFFRSLKNSVIISFITVLFTLLTNSMVSYAIARYMKQNRFMNFLYFFFLSAMFIPFPIIMLPLVKLTSNFHLDNMFGLIFLYIVYGISSNVFIYAGYIKSIPATLDEAATVDGCNPWQTFWHIIFPLLTPINATVLILTSLWAWNDFMLPLIILNKQADMTLPLVQYVFQSKFGVNYNMAFASYLLAMLPMILVYVAAQKWIIGGITTGSVKE